MGTGRENAKKFLCTKEIPEKSGLESGMESAQSLTPLFCTYILYLVDNRTSMLSDCLNGNVFFC